MRSVLTAVVAATDIWMVRRNVLAERLGTSLQRSPYGWLVGTLLSFVLLLPGLAPMATSAGSATLTVVAAGFILYGIAAWVAFPRVTAKRNKNTPSEAVMACILWAFSASPFLIGWAAVAAGGQEWVGGLGFVVSVALLVATARRIARGRSTE